MALGHKSVIITTQNQIMPHLALGNPVYPILQPQVQPNTQNISAKSIQQNYTLDDVLWSQIQGILWFADDVQWPWQALIDSCEYILHPVDLKYIIDVI